MNVVTTKEGSIADCLLCCYSNDHMYRMVKERYSNIWPIQTIASDQSELNILLCQPMNSLLLMKTTLPWYSGFQLLPSYIYDPWLYQSCGELGTQIQHTWYTVRARVTHTQEPETQLYHSSVLSVSLPPGVTTDHNYSGLYERIKHGATQTCSQVLKPL